MRREGFADAPRFRHAKSPARPQRHAGVLAALAVVLGGTLAAEAETRMLVVAGLGGEVDYAEAFADQAAATAHHAEAAGTTVTLLAGEAARRDDIRAALAAMATETGENDRVVVHLIGHGTFDEEHYRFNIPGPDPTAEDLALWLEPVTASRQLAVIATSSSGAAQEPLARAGRTVITATRSGRERNAVVFAGFWADALADPTTDVDKDQQISADEAFRFTEQAVAGFYEDTEQIATEHPRIEGEAGRFIIARTAPPEPVDPEVVHLVDRVDEITAAIDAHRADRRVLTDDDYFARLQELLMELATLERQIKMRPRPEGDGDDDLP